MPSQWLRRHRRSCFVLMSPVTCCVSTSSMTTPGSTLSPFARTKLATPNMGAATSAGDRQLVRIGVSPAIRVGLDLADREFRRSPIVANGQDVKDEHRLGQHDPFGIRTVGLAMIAGRGPERESASPASARIRCFVRSMAAGREGSGPPFIRTRRSASPFAPSGSTPCRTSSGRSRALSSARICRSKLFPRVSANTDCPKLGRYPRRRATSAMRTLCTSERVLAWHAGFFAHCSKRARVFPRAVPEPFSKRPRCQPPRRLVRARSGPSPRGSVSPTPPGPGSDAGRANRARDPARPPRFPPRWSESPGQRPVRSARARSRIPR